MLAIHSGKKFQNTEMHPRISINVFVPKAKNTNVFKAEPGVTCQTASAVLFTNGAHFMLIHRAVFFTRVYTHEYVGIEILAGIFQVEVKKRAWYFTFFLRNAFPAYLCSSIANLHETREFVQVQNFIKHVISLYHLNPLFFLLRSHIK